MYSTRRHAVSGIMMIFAGVVLALVATGCASTATTPTDADGQSTPGVLDAVAFLAGTWASDPAAGPVVEEHWTDPAGGTMFGVNRVIAGGQTPFFEFLEIRAEDGQIIYTARPLGRGATAFPLADAGPGFAVFENRAHDFPQRIRYTRRGSTLTATVSGIQGGTPRSETWTWTRRGPGV